MNRNIVVTKRKEAIQSGIDIRQFRRDVQKEQQLWDEARQYFADRGSPVPHLSDLKAERDRLIKLKSAQQKAYTAAYDTVEQCLQSVAGINGESFDLSSLLYAKEAGFEGRVLFLLMPLSLL